ncbi:MAG: bifunctional nuclease family protein [Sediminibacterium sp.]|nr:bifunctional nuclease family protein [Sediminibacterium sp.]
MKNKTRLNFVSVAYSANNKNTFLMLLKSEDEIKQIPIIIGMSEAQNLNVLQEKMEIEMPMTFDFIEQLLINFDISILEVFIYDQKNGIFKAKIECVSRFDQTEIKSIECRCSDGVALAIKVNVPIFISNDIINSVNIITIEEKDINNFKSLISEADIESNLLLLDKIANKKSSIKDLSIDELEKILEDLLNEEKYVEAAQIRDEIASRHEH